MAMTRVVPSTKATKYSCFEAVPPEGETTRPTRSGHEMIAFTRGSSDGDGSVPGSTVPCTGDCTRRRPLPGRCRAVATHQDEVSRLWSGLTGAASWRSAAETVRRELLQQRMPGPGHDLMGQQLSGHQGERRPGVGEGDVAAGQRADRPEHGFAVGGDGL